MSPANPDFDLDLAFGEKYEGCLADLLNRGKVEVKTERDSWAKTGNLAIEVGKRMYPSQEHPTPSGLYVTKADWWAHILVKDDDIKFVVILPVSTLKRRLVHLNIQGRVSMVWGGDNNASQLILVPLNEIVGNK